MGLSLERAIFKDEVSGEWLLRVASIFIVVNDPAVYGYTETAGGLIDCDCKLMLCLCLEVEIASQSIGNIVNCKCYQA